MINENENEKIMKAKCIKADPLEWLQVGKVYDCTECGQNVVVRWTGFVLSRENFEELFEIVEK